MTTGLRDAWITGGATTAFGSLPNQGALDLMAEAATSALVDARLPPDAVDGVLCGYATTLPHLMLSTVFCERMGIRPQWAHGMALGGNFSLRRAVKIRDPDKLPI